LLTVFEASTASSLSLSTKIVEDMGIILCIVRRFDAPGAKLAKCTNFGLHSQNKFQYLRCLLGVHFRPPIYGAKEVLPGRVSLLGMVES
jgi:hypothetical protein